MKGWNLNIFILATKTTSSLVLARLNFYMTKEGITVKESHYSNY